VKRRPSRITFKVSLPSRSFDLSKPKNRCSGGQFSGPDHRSRYWLMHDPG
jgi:hypothetical protein